MKLTTASHPRRLAGLLKRLMAGEAELYAEQVDRERARTGCSSVDSFDRGSMATLAGRITTVMFTPVGSMPVLTAELFDGTARVTLTWLGRRRIVGVEPGRRILVSGRIAVDEGGRKVVYNPWYELMSDRDESDTVSVPVPPPTRPG